MQSMLNYMALMTGSNPAGEGFTYHWGNISQGPPNSLIFNFSGQTPCCVDTGNGSVMGICDMGSGLQPSFSWGGSQLSSSATARILYLVPNIPIVVGLHNLSLLTCLHGNSISIKLPAGVWKQLRSVQKRPGLISIQTCCSPGHDQQS